MKTNSVQISPDPWDTVSSSLHHPLQWLPHCPRDEGQNLYHGPIVWSLQVSQPHLRPCFLFAPCLPDILVFFECVFLPLVRGLLQFSPLAWNTLTSSSMYFLLLLIPIFQVPQQTSLPWECFPSLHSTSHSIPFLCAVIIPLSFPSKYDLEGNLHLLGWMFDIFISLNWTRTKIVCIFSL